MRRIPVSARRLKRQRGNEIIEFALLAVVMVPTLLYMFVSGMNLIRLTQGVQVSRDVGDLYIHGVDFSTYPAQALANRLSQGFGMNIGSFFSGHNATNDSNAGNGLVVLSQVMYVGAGACASLPSGTACTNQGQYVFLQRMTFGNKTIQFNGVTVASAMGNPSAVINTSGYVQNYLTDSRAVCSTISGMLTTQFADQQLAYIVETFFASSDLNFSSVPGGGVYSRLFM